MTDANDAGSPLDRVFAMEVDWHLQLLVEDANDFAISEAYEPGGQLHIAFAADTREQVDAFHEAALADETFLIHAGRERSVAATKTYTGQMLHFYMLAEALGHSGP